MWGCHKMILDILNTLKYTKEKGRYTPKSKLNKGEILERQVFDTLSKDVLGYKRILVDLLIPNTVGGTTQIDLLLLHSSGIYVIECKNYKATIKGDIEDKEWTALYKGGKTYSLYNPIIQNSGHIDKLMRVNKGYKKSLYKSLILFSKDTILSDCSVNKVLKGCKTVLTTELAMAKCVRGINGGKLGVSKNEIKTMYKELSKYARSNKKAKQKHSDYVNKLQNAKV